MQKFDFYSLCKHACQMRVLAQLHAVLQNQIKSCRMLKKHFSKLENCRFLHKTAIASWTTPHSLKAQFIYLSRDAKMRALAQIKFYWGRHLAALVPKCVCKKPIFKKTSQTKNFRVFRFLLKFCQLKKNCMSLMSYKLLQRAFWTCILEILLM